MLKAVVEIMGSDPNGLREQCEEFCNDLVRNIDEELDNDEWQMAADHMLRLYLRTIDPNTTGADRLAVSVINQEPPCTN